MDLIGRERAVPTRGSVPRGEVVRQTSATDYMIGVSRRRRKSKWLEGWLVGCVFFHVGGRVGMAWKEGWHHVQGKRSCYPHRQHQYNNSPGVLLA